MSYRKHWKECDVIELIRLYPNTSNKELAVKFGRNEINIRDKASKLKLRKSKIYLAKVMSRPNFGINTRFKKGMTAWNKGLKLGSDWCKRTQFKTGQPAHNKLPQELKELSLLRQRLTKNINERIKRAKKQNN